MFVCVFTSVLAHEINGYRYIAVNNPLDCETSIKKYFESIGFDVYPLSDIDLKTHQQREETLIADFDWNLYSSRIRMVNANGTTIFSTVQNGKSHKSCLKKIFKKISELNYKFDSSQSISVEILDWEERAKRQIDKRDNPVEGIYQSYGDNAFKFRVAILESMVKGSYVAIMLDVNMDMCHMLQGDMLFQLCSLDDINYVGTWKNTNNITAQFDGNNFFLHNGKLNDIYVKVYPQKEAKLRKDIQTNSKMKNETLLPKFTGSGVMISSNIIATNYHLIKNATKIDITFHTSAGECTYQGSVLITDIQDDLALLTIQGTESKDNFSIPYNISYEVREVGTHIFTMGYPLAKELGENLKTTDGIISSQTGYKGDISTYQISAPIQPGNSGGALFDLNGNLIGITCAGLPSADNIGYAIKSFYLRNLIEAASIKINYKKEQKESPINLSTLVKKYSPFIGYIKVY